MGDDEKRSKKSFGERAERIKERMVDLIDDFLGALEGLVNPPPVPVPVRARR